MFFICIYSTFNTFQKSFTCRLVMKFLEFESKIKTQLFKTFYFELDFDLYDVPHPIVTKPITT